MVKARYTFAGGEKLTVLETPLLRVSRPVAACSRCRAAKVKCDGKLPACSACERAGRADDCSSTNDQFARGKERSYVATLEARIERLERKIAEERARRKSSVMTVLMVDADSTNASDPSKADAKPQNQRAARRKEAIDIDSLVSDFGLLAVNATARDFYGFTSAMTYSRLVLSAASKEPLPPGLTAAMPPRFAATPLIQHYLNNIFVLLPLLEETSFYASVDAVYANDAAKAKPFDHFIVRMVLAIASISMSEERGDSRYSDALGHVNAALQCADAVLRPGYIASIQALLLLVEYAMLDPHHFDSWTLLGAASRLLVDLGIHQDPARSAGVQRPKRELRRRVFYCLYSLDRSISMVQNRAFSFSDESTHVSLPFSHRHRSPTKAQPKQHLWLQSFDAALDLFRLRQLQSEWYHDLYQSGRIPWEDPYPYIWRTYHGLADWFSSLPASTLASTRSFFQLELLYSYVYILKPSPKCPHPSEYAQKLAFEHCIAYAAKLHELVSDPARMSRSPLSSYDASRAYTLGRQFIDLLAHNPDALLSPAYHQPSPSPLPRPRSPMPPTPPVAADDHIDPFGAGSDIPPPALPTPAPQTITTSEGAQYTTPPPTPVTRAINAVNDFTSILTKLGQRFGFVSWRDGFQRESAGLLAQLYHRAQAKDMAQGYCAWTGGQGMVAQSTVPSYASSASAPASSPGYHSNTSPSPDPSAPSPPIYSSPPFPGPAYTIPEAPLPVYADAASSLSFSQPATATPYSEPAASPPYLQPSASPPALRSSSPFPQPTQGAHRRIISVEWPGGVQYRFEPSSTTAGVEPVGSVAPPRREVQLGNGVRFTDAEAENLGELGL